MATKKRTLVLRILGVLLGVLVAMVALWVMGMIYRGLQRPPHSHRNACVANLKLIDGATAAWAQENKKANSDIATATDLYGATAYIREQPHCPEGGKYVIGNVRQKPRCSIPGHTL